MQDIGKLLIAEKERRRQELIDAICVSIDVMEANDVCGIINDLYDPDYEIRHCVMSLSEDQMLQVIGDCLFKLEEFNYQQWGEGETGLVNSRVTPVEAVKLLETAFNQFRAINDNYDFYVRSQNVTS